MTTELTKCLPLISIEIAGALSGLPRLSAYTAAERGGLPTISFGGRRKYVPVARLAELLGRPITADDIAAAEAVVAARKKAPLQCDGAPHV